MAIAPHRQEVLLQGLLELAPDAIVGVDTDGLIVLVNSQAEQLFGYEREELLGRSLEILVPDRVRSVHPAHRRRYLENPLPRPMGAGMELAARRKDGTEFPAEISLNSVDTGTGILIAAAIRDITERQRAEAKFRGLLEAAPDAIVGVKVDGRIALVNAQAERLFGYKRAEMLGQLVEMLVPDGFRDAHRSHRSGYFTDHQPRPMGAGMQLTARRKDGSQFPVEISLSALDTEEGLIVSAAVRDVTERLEEQAERERLRARAERERLEAQLHQSQRLESLGQLAGGVAHDFNNLLGVISNYAAFVAEEVTSASQGPDGERWSAVSGDVEQIRLAAERATQLTHQLLAFGRREVVRPQAMSLNSVVGDVDQLLRRTLGEHVRLSTDLEEEVWPIMADSGQIEQVLVNLAVNARDAMPDTGVLTISTENILVDEAYAASHPGLRPGRYVRLRASDDGMGMTDDVLRHAFEPFFTTKPKGEGSGLGLATVYGIVTQHEGFASIYSEPGVGTTFTALFPTTEQAVSDRVEQVTDKSSGGGETVLLVEDEDALLEVSRRILARNGYRVIAASCGADALIMAERHHEGIDLLVTDVVMPNMQGKDLADTLLRTRPSLRVLYMSGYARPVLASRGTLEAGVALLEKPFSEAALLAKVREVLGT
jgi:PAS domain S-box-containing protein